MYKNILIMLGLLLVTACSQNKIEPKPSIAVEAKEALEVKTIDVLKVPIKKEVSIEKSTDFIPEHIRRSSIEVVKHY